MLDENRRSCITLGTLHERVEVSVNRHLYVAVPNVHVINGVLRETINVYISTIPVSVCQNILLVLVRHDSVWRRLRRRDGKVVNLKDVTFNSEVLLETKKLVFAISLGAAVEVHSHRSLSDV